MPRKTTGVGKRPRRRHAGAAAIEAEAERGLLLRILLHSPKDMVAGFIAFTACSAIIANALFLQSGPHPAPIFGTAVASPSVLSATGPLPRPRPAEAEVTRLEPGLSEPVLFDPKPVNPRPVEARPVEVKSVEVKPVEAKPVEVKPVEAKPVARFVDAKPVEPRGADPLTKLVKATAAAPLVDENAPRPPAPIPSAAVQITGSRRVVAVQRALTEYGYGQLKPTGTVGPDTRAAIEKFEHQRRMPLTGQVSDRLVRELSAMIGHPID